MFENIVNSCKYLLNNYPNAQDCRNYLNSRLNKFSQDLFEFGYFPDLNNINTLTSIIGENELITNKLLFSSKLGAVSYFDNYPLIIPFKNEYGEIVGLIGRTILSEKEYKAKNISKYKNTQENAVFKKGNLLFGLYENKEYILEKNCAFIVEGQFDVIKAAEKGFRNVIALGSSNMTAYQLSVICRYTNNIFLLLDNDEAGEKGRKRIMSKFSDYANIKNFYIPDDYKDIDECLTKLNISNYTEIPFIIKNI